MNPRLSIARWMLTFVLAATVISAFILDWSSNHLLNPLWHPHARFHGALLLFFLAGACGTGLWLMWREGSPIAVRVAGLLSLSFWTPLFYITTLLPIASSWAGAAEKDPRLNGSLVTPNIVVAAVVVAATLAALRMTQDTKTAFAR